MHGKVYNIEHIGHILRHESLIETVLQAMIEGKRRGGDRACKHTANNIYVNYKTYVHMKRTESTSGVLQTSLGLTDLVPEVHIKRLQSESSEGHSHGTT